MDKTHPLTVIIGMPGAGKTRIGREIASLLDVTFHDSDTQIESVSGMKVSAYFQQYGELSFRKLESEVIIDLLSSSQGIVSLGGGAPMTDSVRKALNDYAACGGKVVYLQVDPAEAVQRVRNGENRPILAGDASQKWHALFEQRDPVFLRVANVHVKTHGCTPKLAASRVIDLIQERSVHVTGDGIEPYDVHIGVNVLERLPRVIGDRAMKVALIHTESVRRHADRVRTLLRKTGYDTYDMLIPDAEAGKTVEVASGIWDKLAREGFTRCDVIVGLGGGAATDVAGFAAATWMRGIRYVNCPTSLLAMVDASTGGKTGINTVQGKNLVGSFYTPAGVFADMRTLETLPTDIFIEGLGEVVKSGFIMDTEILRMLEQYASRLRGFQGTCFLGSDLQDVVAELAERTVKVKVHHVSNDLRETGLREFLNYGHTLGHAIEKIEHFRWRHGNAVAVGCVYAAELSCLLGYVDQRTVDYHRSLLKSLGLPISWNCGSWDEVLTLMHRDKKARGNKLRFVVLESLGHPIHLENPPLELLREAFERIRKP